MKIYIGHSKIINYVDELYTPIKELSKEYNHTFILPHDKDVNSNNSRDFIKLLIYLLPRFRPQQLDLELNLAGPMMRIYLYIVSQKKVAK